MRRYLAYGLGAVLVTAIAAGIYIALQHPPMRLMPAPQIFLRDGVNLFAAQPEPPADTRMEVFYATNRLPVGPAADRTYTIVPSTDLHLGVSTIRIGEPDRTWEWLYQLSTTADDDDDRPFLNLERMREDAIVSDEELTPEALAWLEQVNAALADSPDRDIVVYVHGANTTVERAAGQAAQLMHFTGRNSVVVLFAWPTAENFLRYPKDLQTALGAAPQLARLVALLSEHTDARAIDLFTYSAGSTVGSEGAALVGRAVAAGESGLRLGEVYHAAPDANFQTFVADLKDYIGVADDVAVSVNLNDSALRLAQAVTRSSRAGRPDMKELTPEETGFLLDASRDSDLEIIRVRPENMENLSRTSHSFWYDDPWVSSDVLLLLLGHLPASARGLDEEQGDSGTHYWTFPTDYPERLEGILKTIGDNPGVAALLGKTAPG
ncbi:alpha/beta hydrolase [Paracoccus sp. (in: a-proteobacteria)]|uniref:alpha/beta hydrolase n=1 Tax=Paracoccus sp. TaxID=267 RepID=UPI00322045D5